MVLLLLCKYLLFRISDTSRGHNSQVKNTGSDTQFTVSVHTMTRGSVWDPGKMPDNNSVKRERHPEADITDEVGGTSLLPMTKKPPKFKGVNSFICYFTCYSKLSYLCYENRYKH